MDFISHGLYSVALNKTLNRKLRKSKDLWIAFAWGIMPDVVIGPFFALGLLNRIIDPSANWRGYDLAAITYPFSHSLIVFGLAFFLISLLKKRFYLPIVGWGFHILMDIPLHPHDTYATPFLFPVSTYIFAHGLSWQNFHIWLSFWMINILWLWLLFKRKPQSSSTPSSEI